MKSLSKKISTVIIFILLSNCSTKKVIPFGEYVKLHEESKLEYINDVNMITKANELRARKTDFIAYKSYSIGSVILNKIDSGTCPNCNPDYPLFLFWNENGKTWIQKFDNCGEYFLLELNDSKIADFVSKNFEIIKSEKIKYYRTDKNMISIIDHSTFKQFLIVKSNIEIYNHFDIHNLSNDSDDPNINYQYNNNLKIVKLDKMIKKEIIKLDSQNLFKRDLLKCK